MEHKIVLNDQQVLVNDNGIHIYTETGMITVTPFITGININGRNLGTTLIVDKINHHSYNIIIVDNP